MNFQSSIIHSPLEAVPPGYKRTEVGVIPEDWGVKALCQIGSFLKGRGIKRDDVADDGMPCIRYGEIYTRYNDYVFDPVSRIPPSVALKSEPLKSGDLLFAGSGETAEEIGKCVAFLGKETAFAGGDIVILRPNGQDSLYLGHLFNHDVVVQQKARLGQGDAVVHISARNLSTVRIPLPSITEQRAIAEALSDVDGLIAALDKLIAKKRAIKQAAMQQLLTGKTRLPGFSGEWETKRLWEIADLHRENIVPAHSSDKLFTHFSLPAFDEGRSPAIEPGASIGSNKFKVPANAILVSKLNPRIPRVWLPDDGATNAVASTEFLVLTPKQKMSRQFLYNVCSSPKFCDQLELSATGTTGSHQRITPSDALIITVRVPVDTEEQTAIATVLADMDSEIAALEARRDKTRQIKQGMMQQLLTGRVRLVKPQAEEVRA